MPERRSHILLRAILGGIGLCLGLLGCSGNEPTLYPVRGKILYKGRPIPKAEIVFHPQTDGPGWMPLATVEEDGTFSAGSKRPGDGAPAGRYRLTVTWRPKVDEDGEGPNVLPTRYANPQTSGLEIEVGPDSASLPTIDLKN